MNSNSMLDIGMLSVLNQIGEWTPRNNGTGERIWFCYNERTNKYYYNKSDTLVRYTLEGAIKKCLELNKASAS